MGLLSLREKSTLLSEIDPGAARSFEQDLPRLAQVNGAIPTAASVIRKIDAALSGEPTLVTVSPLVSSDPFLVLRLLALMGSVEYFRGQEILTVEGALSHLGFRRLRDSLRGLAEVEDFDKTFSGRGTALIALQEMLLGSELAAISAPYCGGGERCGFFARVFGTLERCLGFLVEFAEPQFAARLTLDRIRGTAGGVEKRLKELGARMHPSFAAILAEALSAPKSIIQGLATTRIAPWNKRGWDANETEDLRSAAGGMYLSSKVVSLLSSGRGAGELRQSAAQFAKQLAVKESDLAQSWAAALPASFRAMEALGLPPFWVGGALAGLTSGAGTASNVPLPLPLAECGKRVSYFLNQIRTALKSEDERDVFSAVDATLSGLVAGLGFDFAVLMLLDETRSMLLPVACMGEGDPDFNTRRRPLASPKQEYMPDVQALLQKKTVFVGDPLDEDHFPFAAFPVVSSGTVHGVFFAQRVPARGGLPLDPQEQVTVVAFAEEWHDLAGELL